MPWISVPTGHQRKKYGNIYIGKDLQNFLISIFVVWIDMAFVIYTGALFQTLGVSPTKLALALFDLPVSIILAFLLPLVSWALAWVTTFMYLPCHQQASCFYIVLKCVPSQDCFNLISIKMTSPKFCGFFFLKIISFCNFCLQNCSPQYIQRTRRIENVLPVATKYAK